MLCIRLHCQKILVFFSPSNLCHTLTTPPPPPPPKKKKKKKKKKEEEEEIKGKTLVRTLSNQSLCLTSYRCASTKRHVTQSLIKASFGSNALWSTSVSDLAKLHHSRERRLFFFFFFFFISPERRLTIFKYETKHTKDTEETK
jgi:hypothetical protein